jgi:exopolyphosphatase/guanosine-5'-triphosphate,3'-diphosphate pyrophosphatase
VRLGVIDAGATSVHLAIADVDLDGPVSVASVKQRLRLARCVNADGAIDDNGTRHLVDCVSRAVKESRRYGVDELYALGTAVIRDASNVREVIRLIRRRTGVRMRLLKGEDEARLTFVAVRRWFGTGGGPLLLLDIGGGTAEVAFGAATEATFAVSLPLGARRLTHHWLPDAHPSKQAVRRLVRHVERQVATLPDALGWQNVTGRPVAASRTFQQLARLCGAPHATRDAVSVQRLAAQDLRHWIPKLARMSAAERASLPGISQVRAGQSLAGAVVADRLMHAFEVKEIAVCPWTIREGLMLQRVHSARGDVMPPESHWFTIS